MSFREKIIKFKSKKLAAMTGHTEEIHGILKPFGFCYVCWNSTNCDLYLFNGLMTFDSFGVKWLNHQMLHEIIMQTIFWLII